MCVNDRKWRNMFSVVNVKPCETIKSGGKNHRQWQVSRQKMMVLPSKIMVLQLKMNVYHHFFASTNRGFAITNGCLTIQMLVSPSKTMAMVLESDTLVLT